MKTSGRLGTGRLKREWFPVYARYLLQFVQAYAAEGIPIHALTVQNEPFHQDPHYPTTLWSADEQRDFIRDHLGPLLERTGIATQIWCWDHNWNHPEVPRAILSDPQAARFVEGVAFHHYEGDVSAQSALGREFPDKSLYFTEGSVFGAEGARTLIDILRHGARSYNAWVILLDERQRPNRGPHEASPTCIERLDDGTVRVNFDYFMQGQFMKYLQRGAVRLESSSPEIPRFGQVAFRNPDGETALVAANDSAAAVRFGVTAGERRFVAEMPAKSVATFLW